MSSKLLKKCASLFSQTITIKPLVEGSNLYVNLLNGIANERGSEI